MQAARLFHHVFPGECLYAQEVHGSITDIFRNLGSMHKFLRNAPTLDPPFLIVGLIAHLVHEFHCKEAHHLFGFEYDFRVSTDVIGRPVVHPHAVKSTQDDLRREGFEARMTGVGLKKDPSHSVSEHGFLKGARDQQVPSF